MFGTYLSPPSSITSSNRARIRNSAATMPRSRRTSATFRNSPRFSEVLPSVETRRVAQRVPERLHRHRASGGRHARQVHRRRGGGDVRRAGSSAPTTPTAPAWPRSSCSARSPNCARSGRSEATNGPQRVHHLQTRIGLNTGVCMIGNMGSPDAFQLHDDGRQREPRGPHGERREKAGVSTRWSPRRRSSPASSTVATASSSVRSVAIVVKGRSQGGADFSRSWA